MKSVTVFVNRRGGVFVAETMSHEAIGSSRGEACRRCGAVSLGVEERLIEVMPHGSHSMIACVKTPAPAKRDLTLLVGCVTACFIGAVALWFFFRGGAR